MEGENNVHNHQPTRENENVSKPVTVPSPVVESEKAAFSGNAVEMSHDRPRGRRGWMWILIIIVLIAVIFIGFGSLSGNDGENNNPLAGGAETNVDLEDSLEGTSVSATYSLTVNNQPAGDSVTIAKVSLAEPSWVVIHEDRDGDLGNILGAHWVPAGSYQGEMVKLLRETVAGQKYYALIYSDDGNQDFDYKTVDKPLDSVKVSEFETNSAAE